jgi:uncharacterized oligopeptide transporter (OPT) family protein
MVTEARRIFAAAHLGSTLSHRFNPWNHRGPAHAGPRFFPPLGSRRRSPPASVAAMSTADPAPDAASAAAEVYPPRDHTSLQLTIRAVLTGMLLGAILSLCNIYVSLQIGWSTNMSVTGVLLAFAFWRGVEALVRGIRPFGILENNINQAACSAAAAVSSAGLVAPIPALTLMTGKELSWGALSLWIFTVCMVGITAAVAIRRQMIVIDRLPFPGGLATAHTLKEVYGAGHEALRRVAMLGVGALIAALMKIGEITKALGALAIPGRIGGHRLSFLGFECEPSLLMVGVGAIIGTRSAWSMLLGAIIAWGIVAPWAINQGHAELKAKEPMATLPASVVLAPIDRLQHRAARGTLELRGRLSAEDTQRYLAMSDDPAWQAAVTKLSLESRLNAAERADRSWTSFVALPAAHGLAVPADLRHRFAIEDGRLRIEGEASAAEVALLAAGPISPPLAAFLAKVPEASKLVPVTANVADVLEWLLWPGVTLMVVSSLVSFAFSWRSMLRAFRRSGGASGTEANDEGDMPTRWLLRLGLGSLILSVIAQVSLFGIAWWAATLGVVLSLVLAIVASRVSGETNITPIGAMGKVTQLTFGAILPADPAANLMTANVTGGAASQAADLMHDLKTGALLGATPWKQAVSQICGAGAGALAGSAFYLLLIHDPHRQLLTEEWPAPAVATWKAVAELFQRGFDALPSGAAGAMLVAAILGVLMPLVDRVAPRAARPYLPSVASVGLSFVVAAKYAISIFVGAILALVAGRLFRHWAAKFLVTLASGLIVGDALVGAGDAILRVIVGLSAND